MDDVKRVLIIEDDPDIADLVEMHLRDAGYRTDHAADGVTGLQKALDGDWTGRANAYLATHGLALEVCAFYTSDGKSSHPHLVLQFRKAPLSQS